MTIVRKLEMYYVMFEGKVMYKSHIKVDCEQYVFAKSIERRCK